VTAVSDNVSSGGALLYCDRFISPRSEVGLVIVLPLEVTTELAVQVWCSGEVLRVDDSEEPAVPPSLCSTSNNDARDGVRLGREFAKCSPGLDNRYKMMGRIVLPSLASVRIWQ